VAKVRRKRRYGPRRRDGQLRCALRKLPYVDDSRPYKRLAVAALLQACTDAHAGDDGAWAWVHGGQARRWAEALDLPNWPPRWEQLDSRLRLRARASMHGRRERG
jgi:hypothetical protein